MSLWKGIAIAAIWIAPFAFLSIVTCGLFTGAIEMSQGRLSINENGIIVMMILQVIATWIVADAEKSTKKGK